MATKLFLRNSASNVTVGSETKKELLLTQGSAKVASDATATVAGPTAGVQTKIGGVVATWFSNPLQAVTISSAPTVNLWGLESSALANAGLDVLIERCDQAGNVISTIVRSEKGTELSTSAAVQNWTTGAVTSTSLALTDRIKVTVFGNDASGNMTANGRSFTVDYGAGAGVDGDSYISFVETIVEAILVPLTGGAAGVGVTTSSLTVTSSGGGVLITEPFTASDGTNLSTMSGWNMHPANSGSAFIYSNKLTKDNAAGQHLSYHSTDVTGDAYVQEVITMMTAIAANAGLAISVHTTNDDYVYARHNQSSSEWSVRSVTGGSATILGTYTETLVASDVRTMRLERRTVAGPHDEYRLLVDSGSGFVERITWTQADGHTGTKVGIRFGGAASATTGYNIDNLEAGTLSQNQAVIPANAAIALSTFVPVISVGSANDIIPITASLTTTKFAPTTKIEVPFVNSSFTGTDGTDLVSYTGGLGESYSKHSLFTDAITIQSNRAGKDSNINTTVYYASIPSPSLDYTVEGDIVDIGDVSRAVGIAGWIDTATDSMIVARRQNSTTWQLIKIINGTATSIDTEPTTFSLNATNRLKLTRVGNNFEWFLNGVSLGSFTISDSQFQSIGRVGLRSSNNHLATGFHVDNFLARSAFFNVTLTGNTSGSSSASGSLTVTAGGSVALTGTATGISKTEGFMYGTAVTFYTANLQHGDGTDGFNNYSRQLSELTRRADIIAVQEKGTTDTGWDAGLAAAGFTQAIYRENDPSQGDGPAIWYRNATVSVIDTWYHDLSEGAATAWSGFVNVDKAAVCAKVQVGAKRFYVISVHLAWSKGADSDGSTYSAIRVAQINELLSWINSTFNDGLDIIILGDLNFAPDYPKNPSGLQIDLFTNNGYADLWQSGLTNNTAFVPWMDMNRDGVADMPLSSLGSRTHDTRRIDYYMLKNVVGNLGLKSITIPDLRANCSTALTGSPAYCPDTAADQRWQVADDFGVRPSDHNWVQAVLTLTSGTNNLTGGAVGSSTTTGTLAVAHPLIGNATGVGVSDGFLKGTAVVIYVANLQHGEGTDGIANYSRQANYFSSADIVCTQEQNASDTSWNTPMSAVGLTQAIFQAHLGSPGDGNAIWIRSANVSLLQTYWFDLANGVNPTSGSAILGWDGTDVRRTVVAIKAQVGAKQFYVVSLHLVANSGEDNSNTNFASQRVDQINSVLGWVNTTFTDGLDVIISGDFNLPPNYPRATELSFTADASIDTLSANSHGFTDGTAVVLRNSGGAQPSPLAVGNSLYALATVYYVRDATTNTFKLSATRGGAAIDLTSNGSGSNFVAATQWGLFTDGSYGDLWQFGLTSNKALAPWNDLDTNGVADMPLDFQLTRTHDTRRIDYHMLRNSVGNLALRYIIVPDLRTSGTVTITTGTPDDLGVRPSDHNWTKVILNLTNGSISVSGSAVGVSNTSGSLTVNKIPIPSTATLIASTFVPNVIVGGNQVLIPSAATLLFTRFAPILDTVVIPVPISLTTLLFVPVIGRGFIPTTTSLVTTSFVPKIALAVIPSNSTLALTSFVPVARVSDVKVAVPNTASLTLTTTVPTLQISSSSAIVPPPAAILTSRFAPTIVASANQVFIPGTLSVITNRFIPVASLANNTIVVPPTPALQTTQFAPSLRLSVIPAVRNLVIQQYVPIVIASQPFVALVRNAGSATLFRVDSE